MIWLKRVKERALVGAGRAMRVTVQNRISSMAIVLSNVSERKEMTVHSRCNYTGLFSKRIPTRSAANAFRSIFVRLSWFGRR